MNEPMTAARALLMYDRASAAGADFDNWPDVARTLAEALRAKDAPRPKRASRTAEDDPPRILNAQNLLRALSGFSGIVPLKPTCILFGFVRLESCCGTLTVTGTDGEQQFRTVLTESDLPDFDVVADCAQLKAALRGVRGGLAVRIQRERRGRNTETGAEMFDVTMSLSAGGADSMISARDPDDFPGLLFFAHAAAIVDAATLRDALSFVGLTISTEETRYYLNGFHLQPRKQDGKAVLAFASTDGHRLTRQIIPDFAWDAVLPSAGLIIPHAAAVWMQKNLPKSGDVIVTVGKIDGHDAYGWQVQTDAGVYTVKTIDGCFPDYERVIPEPIKNRAPIRFHVIDGSVFREQVDRMAAQASTGKLAMITLSAGRDGAQVNAFVQGAAGKISMDVAVQNAVPRDWTIAFNSRYLRDFADGAFTATMEAPNDPARIDYDGRPDRVAVLMPLRA